MNKIRIYGHVDGVNFDQTMEFNEMDVDRINDIIQRGTDQQSWLHFQDMRGQHLCISFAKASLIEVRAIAVP